MTAAQGPLPQIRTHGHCPCVRARRGECHYLRLPDVSLRRLRALGLARSGGDRGRAPGTRSASFRPRLRRLNAARAASLASRGLTEGDPGIAFGEAVAARDPCHSIERRRRAGAVSVYRPWSRGRLACGSPLALRPPCYPAGAMSAHGSCEAVSQFEPDGPPAAAQPALCARLQRGERDRIADQRRRGRTSKPRSARFWLATPTAIWNGVARQVIQARGLDLSESARALALIYLASADASIACWTAKYTFNFWRPITAIRNGDVDDNARTEADPTWTPLFPTPQHPEYLSGHSTNSSAMATVMMLLFGDNPGAPIVATSPTNPGFERHWDSVERGCRRSDRGAHLFRHSLSDVRRGRGPGRPQDCAVRREPCLARSP